ncbi:MAG: tRNA uridine-5-carboxymethylaminomethyl(34) synthesis GTPase MnmE [Lentisphaerae bacterium GWF2_57_35]|nr:MAG: tRNA uridine-5-carboxymethylaminomethyl(34) synthesis GTPase MnmE [Lentisphaerae bacterium GWF2_57_35]
MNTSYNEDTIAAIATAPGEAGVAAVRISGPNAFSVADHVFVAKGPAPSQRKGQTFGFGKMVEADGTILDEVILLIMRAPHSYTGENTAEIQCHGGSMSSRRILRRVLEAGARLAEPGEFTKRAFLNGRMDLVQAEAVLDLIRARTDRAATAAVEQLEGNLSRRFDELYKSLIQVAAEIEAMLDFSEHELPESPLPDLAKRLVAVQQRIGSLLSTWEEGHVLREGVLVVIAGRANVGKSTLMNALLGHDRSIVSPIPGTTRDTIEEGLVLSGIPLKLVDTAGLRSTECAIEQEGIKRTRSKLDRADYYIYVIDASKELSEEDRETLAELKTDRCLVLLNKIDLGCHIKANQIPAAGLLETCLAQMTCIEDIKREFLKLLERNLPLDAPPHAVISERHRQLLVQADQDLAEALEMIGTTAEEQLVPAISCIRAAIERLGNVTGKEYHAELLDAVFSKFCVGK